MQRRLLAFLAVLSVSVAVEAAERVFDFSLTPPGSMPEGFSAFRAGVGKESDWKVVLTEVPSSFKPVSAKAVEANRLPVLAQVAADPVDERFPVLVFDGERYSDMTLTTRFKIAGGATEQMAGVVFRAQDEKNFYVVRANALDGNVRFYKFLQGERSAPVGNSIPVSRGDWHELTVRCVGNRIHVLFDGKEAIPELSDNSFLSGKVGFMTKSDSLAYFSEAKVSYKPLETLATSMVRELSERQPRLLNARIYGKTTSKPELHVLASKAGDEAGKLAEETELKVFSENQSYFAKTKTEHIVTAPLHDRNGETVGVVKFFLKPFPGQTEAAAITRVLPIVKDLEARVSSARDLTD